MARSDDLVISDHLIISDYDFARGQGLFDHSRSLHGTQSVAQRHELVVNTKEDDPELAGDAPDNVANDSPRVCLLGVLMTRLDQECQLDLCLLAHDAVAQIGG